MENLDAGLVAIQAVYLFAIGMGITTGGILAFSMSLLRSRKGGAYGKLSA